MCIYRPKLSNYLFILIVLISAVSNATNFYERHGNNFIYLDSISANQYDTLTYAPVIWDIGAAFIELRNYYASYGWDSSANCDSAYNAIDLLMDEAWDHGVNFANARGEIMRMEVATSGSVNPEYPDTSILDIPSGTLIRLVFLLDGSYRQNRFCL